NPINAMNMRTFSTLLTATLLGGTLMAQGVITRMNAGQAHFYYDGDIQNVLDIAEAEAGVDTIILGGGTYNLNTDPNTTSDDLFIRSRIVLIGTGIHPDSSLAYNNNGRTEITGNQFCQVFFQPNSSGSEVHGVAFADGVDVDFGDTDLASTNVDSVKFSRCEFTGGFLLGNNQFGSQANDTYIHECLLTEISISYALNTIVRNSQVGAIYFVSAGQNTLFEYNILYGWGNVDLSGIQFEHNVFLSNSGANITVDGPSSYLNNVWVGNNSGFAVTFTGNVTSDSGNVIRYPLSGGGPLAAFPSTTVTSYTAFDFNSNYHLNPNLPSNVQSAGPYGGGDPWKDGSVPFNPHWKELTTPSGTENGTLQGVIIKASAQQD
ncbi:MAG: hypothetical protein KBF67_02835, partial [Flavobacteriales bacterium]|nr:hypothetical protein [Flavobacteriales bacterium]